jgi:hypothetical protein
MTTANERHYSFDTSALIDGIERFYPIKNFPGLWEKIDDLIRDGRLLVSEEAWKESQQADAPLRDWCLENGGNREKCVFATDAAIGAVAGAIVAVFPTWITQGRKNQADPFVIAVAEITSGMVISGEKEGGPANPKIPYVCAQRGVPHGRLVDVIRSEDWRFA